MLRIQPILRMAWATAFSWYGRVRSFGCLKADSIVLSSRYWYPVRGGKFALACVGLETAKRHLTSMLLTSLRAGCTL